MNEINDTMYEDSLGQAFDAVFDNEEDTYYLEDQINLIKVAFRIDIKTVDFFNVEKTVLAFDVDHMKYMASNIRNAEYPPIGTDSSSSAMQTEMVQINKSFLDCDIKIFKGTKGPRVFLEANRLFKITRILGTLKSSLMQVLSSFYREKFIVPGLLKSFKIEFSQVRLINLNATCEHESALSENLLFRTMKRLKQQMAGFQFDGLEDEVPKPCYVLHYIISTRISADKQKRKQPNVTINLDKMIVRGGLPLKKILTLFHDFNNIAADLIRMGGK